MTATAQFAIDRDYCVGHGRCYSLAPRAFVADDMGLGHVRTDSDGLVELDPAAIVNACPEGALTLLPSEKDDRS